MEPPVQNAPRTPELRRILLAADMRTGAEQHFAHGLVLALASGATLHVVHVHPPGQAPAWEALPSVRELLARWAIIDDDSPVEEYAELGLHVRAEVVAAEHPGDVVVAKAAELQPDLVIVGTRGRQGLDRLVRGSVSEQIARDSRVPTLFIGAGQRGVIDLVDGNLRLSRILVPLGGDIPLQRAVDMVARILRLLGRQRVQIVVTHVGDTPIDGVTLPADPGWEWLTDLRQGAVVPGILAAVEKWTPDLVVMATRGRRGVVQGLVGTRTERVLHEVNCPVVSVPV